MLGVDAEVAALDVGDAGDDVVGLVEGEAVEAGGDGGAEHGGEDDGDGEKKEDAEADGRLPPSGLGEGSWGDQGFSRIDGAIEGIVSADAAWRKSRLGRSNCNPLSGGPRTLYDEFVAEARGAPGFDLG